jgi:hypothetical protein
MRAHDGRMILKIIAIVSFILLTFTLSIIANSAASGYEISIYTNISPLVWIFLLGSIIGGVTIITYQASRKDCKSNDYFWLVGFLILIISNFIILSLYIFRGYYIYGHGDVLSHLGMMKDILLSGHISQDNLYPVTHILITQIAEVSEISHVLVAKYLHVFFSILFMLYVYCLSKAIFHNRSYVLLSTAASITLFFSLFQTGIYPHLLSMLMLPLFYYLYFKTLEERSLEFEILFITLLIMYPFFHPISALIVILSLVVMEFSKVLYFVLKNKQIIQATRQIRTSHILISFITFSLWILSFRQFRYNLQYLVKWLSGEASHIAQMSETVGKLEKLHIHRFDIVELLLKMCGDDLIYIILSLIAVFIIFKKIVRSDDEKLEKAFMVSIWFLLGSLLSIFSFISFRIHDPYRILNLNFSMVVTPLLVGYALSESFRKHEMKLKSIWSYVVIVIIVSLIVLPATIGIFSLYTSPYINQPNSQVTQMEIEGMTWLFNYKDRTIKTIEILSITSRFADAILGYNWHNERNDISTRSSEGKNRFIPDHFNYSYHETLGESLVRDNYAIISKYDRVLHLSVWNVIGRFNENDFERLNYDKTVNKLYSNGEFEVYRVNACNIGE